MMKRYIDHEQMVEKNRAIARLYETAARDKELESKGYNFQQRQQEASCFNCKMKNKCVQFRTRRTGGTSGVVSFGGDEKFICEKYVPMPAPSQTMTDKQIKALLKNVKKGLT